MVKSKKQRQISLYRHRYCQRWFEPDIGPELQERHNGDLAAYVATFKLRWSDEEILKHQEEGMQDFAEVERRLLRKAQWRSHVDPYMSAGKLCFDALLSALSTEDRRITAETDFVLAAIDFEGGECLAGGVHGYGYGILDTRQLLPRNYEEEATIDAANFRIARHNQGFIFGVTQRIELKDLRSIIIKSLTIDETRQAPRKVVLVGHGESDLRTLQSLQVDLAKDLPHVVGFVDTAEMTRQQLGQFPSLRTLLQWLKIPHRRDLLHCAGNDAVFTMQALLALAYRRSKALSSAWPALDLHSLAYREVVIPVREKNVVQDWEDCLEEGDSGIELWG